MDIETRDIEQRLAATLAGGSRLVIWQDEAGAYREALKELDVPGATVIDATCNELATKRRVLRDEPKGRFVI